MGKEKKKWFQKGAFEDGYQFGDLTKTILGTSADVSENINAAVLDATENLIDTTAYGVGAVGGLFNKDFQDEVGDFIAKEILKPNKWGKAISDYTNPVGWANSLFNKGDTEENSVFGDKADGMVQSTAHMVGSQALGLINPSLTSLSMGVNSFGSEIEQAYQQDATHLEAGVSGLITAGSEILTEKISGAIKLFKGAKNLDDGIVTALSRKITNKTLRTLAKWGISNVLEAGEEPIANFGSAIGRKITYLNEKEFKDIFTKEDAWDAFIGGLIMSSGFGVGDVVTSTHKGIDPTTKLTARDENAVKKLYENEVAKAESDGTKLGFSDKNKIYNDIKTKFEQGEISNDVINETLIGEDDRIHKKVVNNETRQENALKKEIGLIENIPQEQRTVEQNKRLAQARKQLENLKSNFQRVGLRKNDIERVEKFIENKNAKEKREGYNNYIDPDAFVERLWENSPNNPKNNVEKSQVESVENTQGNGIIEKTAENDIGVPGEYPDSIVWQRRKVPARKFGKGYFGARTKQHDSRVDSYELKLNPNNESYFLIHLDGNPVQFENMKNGVVQDCKLVMGKNSIYYVKEKIPILNKNILQQAKRQLEAANLVGYRVEWLVSDKRAVEQMKQLFYENNLDIIVTYYPE